MTDRRVVSQYHSVVIMLGGAGTTRPALCRTAVLMQSVEGAQNIDVQETANKNLIFCQANFCAQIKVAPMARAMPAIP